MTSSNSKKTLDVVINSFFPVKEDGGYIVVINGKRVSTFSGKSTWRTKAHARSAVLNHIGRLYFDGFITKGRLNSQERQRIFSKMEEEGILKIIEIK